MNHGGRVVSGRGVSPFAGPTTASLSVRGDGTPEGRDLPSLILIFPVPPRTFPRFRHTGTFDTGFTVSLPWTETSNVVVGHQQVTILRPRLILPQDEAFIRSHPQRVPFKDRDVEGTTSLPLRWGLLREGSDSVTPGRTKDPGGRSPVTPDTPRNESTSDLVGRGKWGSFRTTYVKTVRWSLSARRGVSFPPRNRERFHVDIESRFPTSKRIIDKSRQREG